MGERHLLTDKQIESAKPAAQGKRVMLWDALAPSLALRVTDKGHKSFVVQRRVNGRMVKLTLGEYPARGAPPGVPARQEPPSPGASTRKKRRPSEETNVERDEMG